MGLFESRLNNKQILIFGLDSAGKTTLFIELCRLHDSTMIKTGSTFGYNNETIKERDHSLTFWDIGGKDTIRSLWPTFYRNLVISAVIFVIDSTDENRFSEAKMELKKLMNEEELRNAVLIVIFNLKYSEDEEIEKLTFENKKNRLNNLEEKIGLSSIHQSIIKCSWELDLKNKNSKEKDLSDKIHEIKKWLIDKMDVD